MDFIVFIVFGAIAGWLASIVMKTDWQQGTLADIVLGIIGAVVGGFIMSSIGQAGVTGFNLYSLLVSVFGAAVVIYLGRMLHHSR